MSAQGQPPEAGTATPTAPESAPESTTPETTSQPAGLDKLYERMDQMATGQRQMLESLTQFLTPPEEQEPEYDPSEFYDEEGGMTETGARALIADMVNERVEATLAPRDAARLVEQRDDAFEALKEQYPQLQDDKVSGDVLQRSLEWANRVDPKIIERPEFVDLIEYVFRAEYGAAQTSDEGDENAPRPVVLEGASGARRESKPQTVDWQKRVIDAAQSASTRI